MSGRLNAYREATERAEAALLLVRGLEQGDALEFYTPAQLMYGVVMLMWEALEWAYGVQS